MIKPDKMKNRLTPTKPEPMMFLAGFAQAGKGMCAKWYSTTSKAAIKRRPVSAARLDCSRCGEVGLTRAWIPFVKSLGTFVPKRNPSPLCLHLTCTVFHQAASQQQMANLPQKLHNPGVRLEPSGRQRQSACCKQARQCLPYHFRGGLVVILATAAIGHVVNCAR